jgi:CDP-paratose synthetase
MTKILLTGASGFLGSALARHWAAAGHEVHALVRPSSSRTRLGAAAVTMHVAASADEGARLVSGLRPDAVVHTACAYGRAGETARQVFDANLAFGMALLQAVLDGDRRVNFVNTGSVLEPVVSLYALSKRQFSDWGAQLATRSPHALRFIDLRLQHMYGPGDDRSKFTTHVLHACQAGEPVLRLTAGEQERDLIYIDDVVAGYDAVLSHADELPAHELIEVGSGYAPRIRDFVELVHRLTGSTTALEFGAIPYRTNEAMRCVADTTRLRALGWRPVHDLASGLQDTLYKEFQS